MEPAAPSNGVPRTALAAAPCRRAPFLLLCVLLACLGPPSAAAAAPEPDGAPHPTQPAPDPAPGAGGVSARPTQPAPTTSTPTTSPSAPTSSTPTPPTPAQPTTSSPTLAVPNTTASGDRSSARSRRAAKRRAVAREHARRVEAAERARARVAARRQLAAADSLAPTRLVALVPSSSTDDSGSGRLLFLAACALLALLCASGSFLSVATRISRGSAALKRLLLAAIGADACFSGGRTR